MISRYSQARITIIDALIAGYRIVPDDDDSYRLERDIDPDLLRRLYSLLAWQKAFNPITEPLVPERCVDNAGARSPHTLNRLPPIFPLFRLFPKPSRPFPSRVPSTQEVDRAWLALMVEVETRWNEFFPDDKLETVIRDKSGKPRSSIYRAHMRTPENDLLLQTYNHSLALRRAWARALGAFIEKRHASEDREVADENQSS